ncbi:unnamed protein product [Paramecium pentaurelia]|uniref:ABC transporter family protein n=1 Tax=Paramecium pentaurelia TaxID=43138 RepID=A0A8S1XLV9_9CILI|nr:unnamed protein product [Paramecium pentaurelia]
MNKIQNSSDQIQPYSYSSINKISKFFFTWCYPILNKGRVNPLQQTDLCLIAKEDSSYHSFLNYQNQIDYAKRSNSSLIGDIARAFQTILSAIQPYIANIGQTFFIYDKDEKKPSGSSMGQFTLLSVKIQGALQYRVMQKSLSFAMSLSKNYSFGELLTILQVDIIQASNYYIYLFSLWTCIPQLIVGGIIFYITLEENSIVPAIGAVVQVFFGLIFGHYYGVIQKKFMEAKDQRIQLVDESLLYAKQIKLNCLEDFFEKRVQEQRKIELKYLRYQVWMVIAIKLVMLIIMVLSWEIAFIVAKKINFSIISTMIQNYTSIVMTLDSLPTLFKNYQMSLNSMNRIEKFFKDKDIQIHKQQNENSIEFNNVKTGWKKQQNEDTIYDLDQSQTGMLQRQEDKTQFIVEISMKVLPGQFIAIVGSSGSGKSTILRSLLGETYVDTGNISYHGQISVASQEPWIINDSIKNNITYMDQFNQEKYKQVIECCCLQQDIDGFKYKDNTILIEKGDNLSGGQQKRINLARAVYKDADIYLFDDPLSALDIKVKYEIQQKCFEGYLKNKTRILFTNSLANLQNCDMIYIFEDGKMINSGTFAELKNIKQSQIIIKTQENRELLDKQFEEKIYQAPSHQLETQATLIQEEDRKQGNVETKIMKQIFEFQGKWLMVIIIIFYIGIVTTCQLYGNQKMADDSIPDDEYKELAIIYYPIIQVPVVIANIIIILYFLFRGLSTSEQIHVDVIKSLLKASFTKFYNTILIGRLINRLGKDITNIDYMFPNEIYNLIFNIISLLLPLIASIIYLNPVALPVLIVFFIILIVLTIIYYKSLREISRMEAISKSPIVSFYQQILRGILFVRSCLPHQEVIDRHLKNVDLDLGNQVNLNGLQQWYQSIAGTITNVFQTLLFIVCFYAEGSTPFMTYLILLQMQSVSLLLLLVAVSYGNILIYCISFERCLHLANQIPLEEDDLRDQIQEEQYKSNHLIELENCNFQYRPRTKQVLKQLSLQVDYAEKIGIVGRTGAGKSSIIMALTYMLECTDGKFFIEGQSVKQLRLQQLRQKFSVIPQEPLIFMGTLQQNLDPLNQFDIKEIESVAQICQLFKLDALKKKELQSEIQVFGQNLSVGEKQLITLGRCLLNKRSIVLVDEATANIDSKTEEMIKDIFEKHFTQSAMIMIAHKITTIMNCDKIIVLSDGCVTECDTPNNLLLNPNSEFKKIVDLIKQSEQL